MYMTLAPIDFQVRCAPKIQTLIPEPSTATAACGTGSSPSVHCAPEPYSPSDCLAQLEETRDVALKARRTMQHLWITSNHNKLPTRSALPNLNLELYSNIRFRCLQCIVDDLDSGLASSLATYLEVKCSDTLNLCYMTTVVGHEQQCITRFYLACKKLAPHLQYTSKEVYDLLESALRTIRKLENQLDDIHHYIHGFLEPLKASNITKLACGVTSADVESSGHETQSGLRWRGSELANRSYETLDSQDGSILVDERKKTR
jgi:hypothetical protein